MQKHRQTQLFSEGIEVWVEQGGGWHDILGYPRYRSFGLNVPTQGLINGTVFSGWEFAVNDWLQFDYHVLHDYVPGSAIYMHVHWLADGSDANTVKWQFQVAAAKGHGECGRRPERERAHSRSSRRPAASTTT